MGLARVVEGGRNAPFRRDISQPGDDVHGKRRGEGAACCSVGYRYPCAVRFPPPTVTKRRGAGMAGCHRSARGPIWRCVYDQSGIAVLWQRSSRSWGEHGSRALHPGCDQGYSAGHPTAHGTVHEGSPEDPPFPQIGQPVPRNGRDAVRNLSQRFHHLRPMFHAGARLGTLP